MKVPSLVASAHVATLSARPAVTDTQNLLKRSGFYQRWISTHQRAKLAECVDVAWRKVQAASRCIDVLMQSACVGPCLSSFSRKSWQEYIWQSNILIMRLDGACKFACTKQNDFVRRTGYDNCMAKLPCFARFVWENLLFRSNANMAFLLK